MISSMKQKILLLILCLPFLAFAHDPVGSAEPELIVNNRILATVNGKAISVIDVMKKMDVLLSRNYPEYADSNVSRYQFFSQNWRQILNQIIDNELIMADAENLEIKITDSELRETIHNRFGPNVMASLDKLGITYDEAWQMLYSEMAVQRMSWYRVQSKGLQRIGPQDIKVAYEHHLVNNPPKEEWKYQVISIRATTEALGKVYAQKAHSLIRSEPIPFEALAEQLKKDLDEAITVNVSEEYNVESRNLSESHKAALCNLQAGDYSEPVSQVSRFDHSTVHRIFYLKDHTVEKPQAFDSMVDTLHDELVMKEINDEFPVYLSKLRKKFNYDASQLESLPRDFEPFTLH